MVSLLLAVDLRQYQTLAWDELVDITDPATGARAKINAPHDNRVVFSWIWENMPECDTLVFDVSPFKWYSVQDPRLAGVVESAAVQFNSARVLYLMYEYADIFHAITQAGEEEGKERVRWLFRAAEAFSNCWGMHIPDPANLIPLWAKPDKKQAVKHLLCGDIVAGFNEMSRLTTQEQALHAWKVAGHYTAGFNLLLKDAAFVKTNGRLLATINAHILHAEQRACEIMASTHFEIAWELIDDDEAKLAQLFWTHLNKTEAELAKLPQPAIAVQLSADGHWKVERTKLVRLHNFISLPVGKSVQGEMEAVPTIMWWANLCKTPHWASVMKH
jgi:hypothetical protein